MHQDLGTAMGQGLPFQMGNPSTIFKPGGPKVLKDFKEFALRGSVMDMAIGIIMGVAFGRIVTSFVQDILMPPIGLVIGHRDSSNLFIALSRQRYATFAAAKAAGVATINYGVFMDAVLNFVIVAFAIFMLVRQINRFRQQQEAAPAPVQRECPYCFSLVSPKASRCGHCTSELKTLVSS
jgi:large conductance mechanosensitive channel